MVRPLSKGPGYERHLAALIHKLRRSYLGLRRLPSERYEEQLAQSIFSLALASLGKTGQFFVEEEFLEVFSFAPLYVEGLRSDLATLGTVAHSRTLTAFYLSRLYESLRFGLEKRPGGSYYTPPRLAYAVAAALLEEPLVQGDPPVIYDPCVGTGCLLLPFLDLIGGEGLPLERKQVLACLRGMDQDRHALSVAQILMVFAVLEVAPDAVQDSAALVANFKQELTLLRRSRRFRQGDSLAAKAIPDFDLLAANPPWQSLKGTKDLGAGNISRLFLERCAAPLLYQKKARRVALILPASLLVDKSARQCRGKLLEHNLLKQISLFDNADRSFPAHLSLQYSLWLLRSEQGDGGVRLSSGRAGQMLALPTETVLTLSGSHQILLLPDNERQLALMLKLRDALDFARILGENALFQLGREFDMTIDRACFLGAPQSRADGVTYLPLLEGRMVSRYGLSGQSFVTGRGRSARWQSLPQSTPGDDTAGSVALSKERLASIKPQFYLKPEFACQFEGLGRLKLCFHSTGAIGNRHLMVAAPVPDLPCGNSLTVLKISRGNAYPLTSLFCLLAVLNSMVFDFQLEKRLYGNNLNQFLVSDCSLPEVFAQFLGGPLETARLSLVLAGSVVCSLDRGLEPGFLSALEAEGCLSIAQLNCLRLRKAEDPDGFAEEMELAVASLYGLSPAEFQVLQGRRLPPVALGNER